MHETGSFFVGAVVGDPGGGHAQAGAMTRDAPSGDYTCGIAARGVETLRHGPLMNSSSCDFLLLLENSVASSTSLPLYCQHSVSFAEPYGSAVGVAPDIDAAIHRLVLNNLLRLSPDCLDFPACHANARLGRRNGRCRKSCIRLRLLWIALRRPGLVARCARRYRTYRIDTARKILIKIGSILCNTLEDLRGCERSDEQQTRQYSDGFRHSRVRDVFLKEGRSSWVLRS